MNTQLAPYNDPRVRRAISLAINRDQIDEVVYEGAKIATIYPFPLYPGLKAFVDSPEVKALEAKYQPRKFDLAESAKLMTEAGFKKNGDGLWAKDGKTVDCTIHAFEGIHSDIVPVLVEMLRKGGFDAAADFSRRRLSEDAGRRPGPLHVRPRREPEGPLCGVRTVPWPLQRGHRHDGRQQPVLALQEPGI